MMNCDQSTRRDFLHQLLAAIEDDRLIACRLYGENEECKIAVYGLVFQRDKCYVVGVKSGDAKIKIWDDQQLVSIQVLNDRFEMPPDFKLEKSDVSRLFTETGH